MQCGTATDISPISGESQAKQIMGTADSEKLMSFIEWISPFDADPSLRTIVSSTTLYNVDMKLPSNMQKDQSGHSS